MRTRSLLLVMLPLLAALATAQSNQTIDDILAEDAATFGHAVYLAFLASEAAPADSTVEDVYGDLDWSRWNLPQKSIDEPVTLGEFSYLVMENLGISGGIMYGLSPGPRYAAKEFAYLDFLLGNGSPYRKLSGEEMLHVLGQALAYVEEAE